MPRCHLEATNLQPKRKKGVAPVSGGVEKVGRFDPTPCRKNWKMLYDAFMMHSCCIHDAMCDCMLQFFSSLLFFHGRKQEEWNIDIHWYVETFLKLSWNIDLFIKLLGCWDVGLVLSENSIQVVLGSSPSAQDNYLKAVGRVLSGDGPVDKHKAAQADTKSLTDFTAEICIWHIKSYKDI